MRKSKDFTGWWIITNYGVRQVIGAEKFFDSWALTYRKCPGADKTDVYYHDAGHIFKTQRAALIRYIHGLREEIWLAEKEIERAGNELCKICPHDRGEDGNE